MKQKTPTVICFDGKSGAGKTYVKDQLLKNLSFRYKCRDVSDVPVTFSDYCYFIVTAPPTFLSSVALIAAYVPRSYFSMLKICKKWFGTQVKLKKASRLDCDFVLNDEGLFTRWNWLTNRTLRKVRFGGIPNSIRKNLLYPDITVFVMTDFNLSEQRRMRRDAGRKTNLTEKKKMRMAKSMEVLIDNVTAAEKYGVTKIIRYDNNGLLDTRLADKIISFRAQYPVSRERRVDTGQRQNEDSY